MADLFFKCTGCGRHLVADEAGVGATVPCSSCEQSLVIQAPALNVECARCRQQVKATDDLRGEAVHCPSCGAKIWVPHPVPAEAPVARRQVSRPPLPPVVPPAPLSRPLMSFQSGMELQDAEYPLRFASGKGGLGKRIKLHWPGKLRITSQGQIILEGKYQDQTASAKALVAAIFATLVTAMLILFIERQGGFCAGPGCCIWYLIFAKIFEVEQISTLTMLRSGGAVYDDQRQWFSIDFGGSEWVSFHPAKSSSIFAGTDPAAYVEIKQRITAILGDRCQPYRRG